MLLNPVIKSTFVPKSTLELEFSSVVQVITADIFVIDVFVTDVIMGAVASIVKV